MLPVPQIGVGSLALPQLPPTPSGPNPIGPNFGSIYDKLLTSVPQPRPGGLPTSMEVAPLMSPSQDLSQPFKPSAEFPNAAIDGDGLRMPQKVSASRMADGSMDPGNFIKPLQDGLNETSQLAANADKLANQAAIGGDVDLHDVMIASEKAGVATQLVIQVRNQMVAAYQDVMRMQV